MVDKKMNVLIVHAGKGFYGGAEEVVTQLDNYLRLEGYRTKYKKECNVKGIFKDIPKEFFGHWHPADMVLNTSNWKDFRRCVRQNLDWADVINVHNFPATLAPFPTKKPIVWMCNEPPELFTNWKRKPIEAFNRWWVNWSGMKVVVADGVQAKRFEDIYGVEPKVIPYGIDYQFWSGGEHVRKNDGVLKLLQVGTITPYKNQFMSIFSSIKLFKMGFNVTLSLVGGPTDKSYYEDLFTIIDTASLGGPTIGVKNRIRFLGQKSKEEVRELYHTHDILLHPVKEQGGWLVPFEAMCAGLPVIVSPQFTGASIIKENQLGYVTNNYAFAIKQLYDSRNELDLITPHAKEWVKENLTWKKFGERMLKVFEEAVNEDKR